MAVSGGHIEPRGSAIFLISSCPGAAIPCEIESRHCPAECFPLYHIPPLVTPFFVRFLLPLSVLRLSRFCCCLPTVSPLPVRPSWGAHHISVAGPLHLLLPPVRVLLDGRVRFLSPPQRAFSGKSACFFCAWEHAAVVSGGLVAAIPMRHLRGVLPVLSASPSLLRRMLAS